MVAYNSIPTVHCESLTFATKLNRNILVVFHVNFGISYEVWNSNVAMSANKTKNLYDN